MAIIIVLITLSLSIAILFLGIFFWSIRSGQYEDTYTPSVRILFENKPTDKIKKQGKQRRIEMNKETPKDS